MPNQSATKYFWTASGLDRSAYVNRERKILMSTGVGKAKFDVLRTLPGDDVRQVLWRFSDRYDLQMLVQSVREVARGPVARLVAQGARNTHEWTPEKNALLQAFDESGITGVFMDPGQGGFIEGPKNPPISGR